MGKSRNGEPRDDEIWTDLLVHVLRRRIVLRAGLEKAES